MAKVTENDLEQKQRNLWKKATAAAEVKNWDYVMSLVPPILEAAPGFLDGRKLLRHAAITQQASKGGKKSFLGSFGGVSTSKAKSTGKKDPAAGMAEVEKALIKDPYHVDANKLLHDFAIELDFPETAAFALETVRKGHPENTKVMHKLAEYYLSTDEPSKAAVIYNAILKVDPTDINAQTAANHASARASMQQTGLDKENADMRSLLKDADQAKKIEESNRAGMTREQTEQALIDAYAEYEQDNTKVPVVRKVAELHGQLEQWSEAHQFYAYALSLSPGDSGLERRTLNAEAKANEVYLAQLEDQIENAESDEQRAELQDQLEEIRRERAVKLVAEARTRVERNPTDPHLRLELAEHLYSLGEYSEAIPHLQRARTNPNIRARTLLLLGQTYEAKEMYDLASSQFEEALSELNTMDATKKDLLYATALVYEKQDKKTEYLECLKKIYEVDYHYRDVAERVEASY